MRTPAHEPRARAMHEAGDAGAGVSSVSGVSDVSRVRGMRGMRGALGMLTLLAGPVFAAAGVVSVPDPLPTPLPPLPSSTSLPSPSYTGSAEQRAASRALARTARADRVNHVAAAGVLRHVVAGEQDDHADHIAPDGPDMLHLVSREQRLVVAPAVQRVAIGDPDVADIVPVNDGVLVLAKRPGTTQLSIWSGRAAVPAVRTVEVRAALTQALPADSGARVDVHDDTAVLSGTLASLPEQQLALAAARQSAAKVIDRSQIASTGTVQVDVKIVEFSKSVLKEAGFNLFSSRSNGFGFGVFGANNLTSYTPGASGLSVGTTVGTALSSAFNLVAGPFGNGLFANLSVLETNGLARVLAQPTLVALSGQSASFLAGGELPIPVSAGLGTTSIQFKPFGIGLTVTPTVLSGARIALKVAPEASELDYTHSLTVSGTTIPAITTRRADTAVELGDGESFVIGGLVSRSTIASVDKVPLLGDLPVIGAFFKTLNYQRNDRELVIVVTPHLVRPIARGVDIPVPAEGRDEARDGGDQPVWGAFLGGAAAPGTELPGFSR